MKQSQALTVFKGLPGSGKSKRLIETVNAARSVGRVVATFACGESPWLRAAEGFCARHFPQDAGGGYAGYHPHDSAEARAMLEAQRQPGEEWLAFPPSSLWWLAHYGEFQKYLDEQHRRLETGNESVIYQLSAKLERSLIPLCNALDSTPSPPSEGGEGRGEEGWLDKLIRPSPQPSPRSCLTGRGSRNATVSRCAQTRTEPELK